MVRLLDARDGSMAEVRSAVPGLLRICAHLPRPEPGDAGDITDLRVLLVADLLTRAGEMSHLQALVAQHFSGQHFSGQPFSARHSSGQPASRAGILAGHLAALGMHAPAAQAPCREAHVALGGPVDVHLVRDGASAPDDVTGLRVSIGAARFGTSAEAGQHDHEPLALRLVLLSSPYHQPVQVSQDRLADAAGTLREWRVSVARWAELPSRRVPPDITEAIRRAFRDLDTPSALGLLRTLALDTGMAEGAKFETFVYADRVLGLEFASRIGQV
ncbi:MAG: hypothetical protein JO345_32520 [Streptosporangiaceae bacterium]|nr:hypothetical protein [Streptosporangiaceae bacterium]